MGCSPSSTAAVASGTGSGSRNGRVPGSHSPRGRGVGRDGRDEPRLARVAAIEIRSRMSIAGSLLVRPPAWRSGSSRGSWLRSVIEMELEKDKILPSTELGADLRHPCDLNEAQSFVEANRCLVRTVDGGNHRVFPALPGLTDECLHKLSADARSPVVLSHVHRVLHSEPIPGLLTTSRNHPKAATPTTSFFSSATRTISCSSSHSRMLSVVWGVSVHSMAVVASSAFKIDPIAAASALLAGRTITRRIWQEHLAQAGGLSWIGSPLPGSGGPARGEESDPGLGWMAQEVVDPDVRGATSPNLEHRSEMEKLSLPHDDCSRCSGQRAVRISSPASRPCTRHGHSTVERSHDAHHRRALTHAGNCSMAAGCPAAHVCADN